jgi:alkylation response protein AidB-like acyl-CoA dehydrogenase
VRPVRTGFVDYLLEPGGGAGWRLHRLGEPGGEVHALAGLSVQLGRAAPAEQGGSVITLDLSGDELAGLRTGATVLRAAGLVGLAAEILAMTVVHAGGREQFGQVIGRFQALKHLCADLHTRLEVAWLAVLHAGVTPDDPLAVDGAAHLAAGAALDAARVGAQLHGGMGFTWERPALAAQGRPGRSAGDRTGRTGGAADRRGARGPADRRGTGGPGMNVDDSPEESRFRAGVRSWLAGSVPDELRGATDFARRVEIDRLMAGAGLLGLTWARSHGGQGRTAVEASILDEEATRHGIELARSPSRIGLQMMGPAVIGHGSDEQRSRFLPPVLRVEELWCQGFSEPDAGSDLAGVRTLAGPDGTGGYRVTGAKLWTTQAQHADRCLLLARTDTEAPRHHNLTMFLMDMRQPGVTVSPIVQANGEDEFNELHLDGAAVPAGCVLGRPGEGWRVAMTTLSSERSYALRGKYVLFAAQLMRIAGLIRAAGPAHPRRSPWLERLGELHAAVSGIRDLSYRFVSLVGAGEPTGHLGPVSHLWWSTTHQRLVEFGYEVAGTLGEDLDYWYKAWIDSRAETIYGGTSQIQRNIISERLLGMPR